MRDILEILSGGDHVSGEKISAELGVSRAAVWKRIQGLKEQGFAIESAGKKGYRLLPGDSLAPSLWVSGLKTRALGRGEIRYEPALGSTNAVLKEMAVKGAPHGSLALCDTQTAGRGRLGRPWVSPAGQGLWCSLLLRPALAPDQASFITLCAAMAMAQAITRTCPVSPRIKWPNDLVVGGKKCTGILLELSADPDRVEWVIVGTGVDLHPGAYPAELQGQAVSLEEMGGAPLRRDLLAAYLAALEPLLDVLEKEGFQALLSDYQAMSCTLGSPVHVVGANVDFTGVAESLDEGGALLVRTQSGELRRVLSGDVSVRGVMGYV